MNKYETIFILDNRIEEATRNSLVEKFKGVILSDGEIENVDVWGTRKLAYPINDLTEGYYVLVNFKANSDLPQELDRVYRITEGVLRHIIIREDEK
jgi:small subunit ribosomal protein S6